MFMMYNKYQQISSRIYLIMNILRDANMNSILYKFSSILKFDFSQSGCAKIL